MPSLRHGFVLLLKRNPDGSFQTRGDRSRHLVLISKQLREEGFRQLLLSRFKLKHVMCLVDRWHREGLSPGTIKNRMSTIRWAFEKMGKGYLIPQSNLELGICDRIYSDNDVNKAKTLDLDKLNRINNPYISLSLELQSSFGLRREESIKFSPTYSIKNNEIHIKGSTAKGGKFRVIPIRNDLQKSVLERVSKLSGNGALIPKGSTYIQQLRRYKNACQRVGLSKNHGLRHCYAQERYLELTGWLSPKAGGVRFNNMTIEQKSRDQYARSIISRELGHEREAITVVYLGR